MRKNFLLLIMFLSLGSVAQDFRNPVDYLNYLGKEQMNIARSTWRYTSAVANSTSARRIETTRKQLVNSIKNSSKKIEALKNGYKGDVEFRDKLLTYLYVAEKNINEEYSKIINLQDVSQQSYDYMEAYMMTRDWVNKKLDEEFEKVKLAHNEFAHKYNVKVSTEENDLGKKIRLSNEVFDYHTVLFLLFFKVNITDVNLSKAIEKKDLALTEQYASTLRKYADEGLLKLKSVRPYLNDESLLIETERALLFYQKATEEFVPKVVSYLQFYHQFDNTKKAFEGQSSENRTEQEVENYNTMVKQVNQQIAAFNRLSNENYQDKTKVLNDWNAAGDEFIAKYVPQD